MKKTKLKKQSKQKTSVIQRKLWELCKQIIRNKYGNECYTCDQKNLEKGNWHTGHFLPKGSCGAFLKYDLRNLRPQCYNCNINLGGNGAEFMRRMLIREGEKTVQEIFEDRNKVIKGLDHYLFLTEKYKIMVEEL